MYELNIGVLDDVTDKIEKVCSDIQKRDSTFEYKIRKTYIKKFNFILVLIGEDKKDLEKRAGWIIHKMKDAKVSDYFWTKCK